MQAFVALGVVLHLPFVILPLGTLGVLSRLSDSLSGMRQPGSPSWSHRARTALLRPTAVLLLPQLIAFPVLVWATLKQEQIGTFALAVGVLAMPFACLAGWLFLAHDLLADLVQDLTLRREHSPRSVGRALHLGGNALAKGALVYLALFVCSMQPPFATGISIAIFIAGLNVRRIHDRFRDLDDIMRVRAHGSWVGSNPPTHAQPTPGP